MREKVSETFVAVVQSASCPIGAIRGTFFLAEETCFR